MKYSVKFQLSTREGMNAKSVPIRLRVCYSGYRIDIHSGYVIEANKWDKESQRVTLGSKNCYKQTSGEINRGLSNMVSKVEEVLTRFELEHHRTPTPKEFKPLFYASIGRHVTDEKEEAQQQSPGFFEVFDRFNSEMGVTNNWTKATYTKFASIKHHLMNFRPELSLDDFSKSDFAAFVSYLQKEEGQLNTTVAKNVGFVRWFLRWASANGYYSGAAHLQYRPRFKGLDCKEVIFLTWDELQHFMNFKFPPNKPSLSPVRDVFCFCCFTGLRYSDVARLKSSDVKRDAVPPYISIVTKKTTDRLHIELNSYALAILDKYKGIHLPGNKALPVLSNVKMNEHLHEAAEIAGLDELVSVVSYSGSERKEVVVPKYAVLTTHCGRRTFIVNALRLGIPASVIMEWTGHSDYKAMKPYIKIVDAAKAENMARFDNFGKTDNNG